MGTLKPGADDHGFVAAVLVMMPLETFTVWALDMVTTPDEILTWTPADEVTAANSVAAAPAIRTRWRSTVFAPTTSSSVSMSLPVESGGTWINPLAMRYTAMWEIILNVSVWASTEEEVTRICLNPGGAMTVAFPAAICTSVPPDWSVTKLVPDEEGSTSTVICVAVIVAGVKIVMA